MTVVQTSEKVYIRVSELLRSKTKMRKQCGTWIPGRYMVATGVGEDVPKATVMGTFSPTLG